MKPAFALSLSYDGITLLHRAAGGWRLVGEVALDAPDLPGALADLRARALLLEPEVQCKVVIPNEEIRYLSIDTGPFEGEARLNLIESQVDAATPYALDELVYDVSPDGDLTHVAAAAKETLAEAESFALEHGFEPLSFVAIPNEEGFLGEPFFGPSRLAADLTGSQAVEPDGIAVVIIGEVSLPKAESAPEAVSTPEASPAQVKPAEPEPAIETGPEASASPVADPKPEAPAIGFSSRRKKPDTEKPAKEPETEVVGELIEEAPSEPEPPATPGFQSRRGPVAAPVASPSPPPEPAPPVAPVHVEPPSAPKNVALPIADPPHIPEPSQAIAREAAASAQAAKPDEASRLTVFGARKVDQIGGKPKYLGLALTAVLVLLMAAVAAWATLFSPGGLGGLFRSAPEAPDTPALSQPADTDLPEATPPDTPVSTEAPEQPQPEPQEDLPAEEPAQPETLAALEEPDSALTETDSAVLDALRIEPQVVEPVLTDEPESEFGDAVYAATGIWDRAPFPLHSPGILSLDDLYVASIDRTDLFQDAIALPGESSFDTDPLPETGNAPVTAGAIFALDDRGLVTPSPEGTLNPDGVIVYLGRPALVPPAVPVRFETAPEVDEAQERLAGFRPRLRPENLVELAERNALGGRSLEELAGVRPKLRPRSIQERLEAERLAEEAKEKEAAEAETEQAEAEAEEEIKGTKLAVAVAKKPKLRPKSLEQKAARQQRQNTNLGSTANVASGGKDAANEPGSFVAGTVKPKAKSPSTVARQATMQNAINLRKMNLIGVYGTPANRRALVRLPSGRYKKVKVGDRIDGGRVVAIGDSELRYQKSGRNVTLKIPKS